jgi:hypothetical protein
MHFSEDKPTKFSMLWLDTLFHGRFRSNMDRQIPLLSKNENSKQN